MLRVESVSPVDNATSVNTDTSLTVTFNRELTYLLKNVIPVTLKKEQTSVGGTLSFYDKTADFVPDVPLDLKTTYQGSVQIGLK